MALSCDNRYKTEDKRIVLVGDYGSGKTEVAVNLALMLRRAGDAVAIADLDLVNPYFRCREANRLMTGHGIRVVMPEGDRQFADLPIVVPEIKGLLQNDAPDAPVAIFDVGGDGVGARILAALGNAIGERKCSILQVVNTRRPFTSTPEGCIEMMTRISRAAGRPVTGLVVNTHLMDDTTPDVIIQGHAVAEAVSERSGVPIAFVAVMASLVSRLPVDRVTAPVLALTRRMAPPWVPSGSRGDDLSASVARLSTGGPQGAGIGVQDADD